MIKHLQNKDTQDQRLLNFKSEPRIIGESEIEKKDEAKIVDIELARLAHLFNAGKSQKISDLFSKKIKINFSLMF
ncbi:hypothetical protein WR25_01786 [Diploscapter pachys]|uniref:Uncharacterized protein n=1 Tax=Diploscapter pachys TaxID=2018661 RepID=A0A2A2LTR2_9BILA|nr:hypothetical protein WR25_01786 [Diploscapter pachys]